VAHVLLGQLVVGQVERSEAVAGEAARDLGRLAAVAVARPTNTWACFASEMR
jgi:hypothetical protein